MCLKKWRDKLGRRITKPYASVNVDDEGRTEKGER